MFASASFATVGAQEAAAPEYKLKAVFLYNFAKLVQWPANAFAKADTPITIGVLGKDPFGTALEEVVSGKTIAGRKLAVARFTQAADASHCQILFVSTSENDRLAAILPQLDAQPILTVGETERFARQGGIIALIKREDIIRFGINSAAAEKAHLKLSSKLLRLAVIVKPDVPETHFDTNGVSLEAEAPRKTNATVP